MSAIKSYSSTKERQSSGSFILYARITSAALYYIIIFLKRNHWIERDFQRSNNGIFNHFMLKRIVSVSEFRLLLSIHYLPRIILQYVHQSFNFTTRSFTADLLFERNSIYTTIFFLCSSACLSKKMTRWQWLWWPGDRLLLKNWIWFKKNWKNWNFTDWFSPFESVPIIFSQTQSENDWKKILY